MNKHAKKISLNRETLRQLTGGEMQDANGGAVGPAETRGTSCVVRCAPTANTCITHCGCPTLVSDCTVLC